MLPSLVPAAARRAQRFVVHNVKELEVLLMHHKTVAAEIAHDVSSRKRKASTARSRALLLLLRGKGAHVHSRQVILERAAQLDIKVTNANARAGRRRTNRAGRKRARGELPHGARERRRALLAEQASAAMGGMNSAVRASPLLATATRRAPVERGEQPLCPRQRRVMASLVALSRPGAASAARGTCAVASGRVSALGVPSRRPACWLAAAAAAAARTLRTGAS